MTHDCPGCKRRFASKQTLETHILKRKKICCDAVTHQTIRSDILSRKKRQQTSESTVLDGERGFTFLSPTAVSFDMLFQEAVSPGRPDSDLPYLTTALGASEFSSNLVLSPAEVIAEGDLFLAADVTGSFQAALDNLPPAVPLSTDKPTAPLERPCRLPIDMLQLALLNPVEIITAIPTTNKTRRAVADSFHGALQAVIKNPTSEEEHVRLLLFTSFVLARKSQPKTKQATMTKMRAHKFRSTSTEELLETILKESLAKSAKNTSTLPSLKSVSRLIAQGRYSDAVRMLTSEGVHPETADIISQLEAKHPQSEEHALPEMCRSNLTFSAEDVTNALNEFPNGSTGGPFALTELLLKNMTTQVQIGGLVLNSLAAYAGLFTSGKFPTSVAPFYGGARLIPLIKKDGGVRPMAVGETLRRLVCKLTLKIVKEDVPPMLLPFQLGVGTPLGSEAVIHSISEAISNLKDDEAILQVDFQNAFNLISRDAMFELTKTYLPKLFNLIVYLYGHRNVLRVGNSSHVLLSCTGVQQGCPLAPLLFSIVLQELVKELPKELTMNLWYLDDGHLVGKTNDLLTALNIIDRKGRLLGLCLNLKKCVALGNNLDILPEEIVRADEGLLVLGSPVGCASFVAEKVTRIVQNAASVLYKSRALNDPQKELLLLRCCSGAPKICYWLRTCRPEFIADQLQLYDRIIDDELLHIFGVAVKGVHRKIAHLPLSLGGLGIPVVAISSDAAFVSSVGSSWSLQPNLAPRPGYLQAVTRLLLSNANVPELQDKSLCLNYTPLITKTKEFLQSKITLSLNTGILADIVQGADLKLKVLLQGRASKGASYWLTTAPNAWSQSAFDAASFRMLLKYFTGFPLISVPQKCPDCDKLMDIHGHHALSCKVASGKIHQHNSVVEGLASFLQSASINFRVEDPNPANNSQERPGDIFIADFDNFGDAYLDVSVISICAESYYQRASKEPLAGSQLRYLEKKRKYPELRERFKPMVIESTGGWHGYSFDVLKQIAELVAARIAKPAKDVLSNMLAACSIRLQRHQGSMLVRRCQGL